MTFSPGAIEAATQRAYEKFNENLIGCCEPTWSELTGDVKQRLRDSIDAALTSALAVDGVALQGWQPIESAPINRAILIKTNAPDYYGNSGIYEAMLVDMGSGRRWATFGHGVGRDLGYDWKPTHWMPLPPPPAASDREERR